MLDKQVFEEVISRAALAPSVHNVQPARWRQTETGLALFCDMSVGLAVGDPEARDAALSCGAALEAAVLALSARGFGAEVADHWDRSDGGGLRPVATLDLREGGAEDGLHRFLEARFTWRGLFAPAPDGLFGWGRSDAVLVTDASGKEWIAARNDGASLEIMQDGAFRRELLGWMRLSDRHPRAAYDGMSRAAMRMSGAEAFGARFALGPLWGLLDMLGLTKGLTAEKDATQTADVIALFHRPADESPVASGRAYLRMCLEAASLGMAGWPMAALSDHPQTRAEICARYGIGTDRRLVQCIRFGKPTGEAPPRARRPLSEVVV